MTLTTSIPGICSICGKTLPGSRVRRHLVQCIRAMYGATVVERTGIGDRNPSPDTLHISVRAQESPHWIELGVRSDSTLHELDRFLRSVWLECCGHLSHFEIGGIVHSTMVPMPGESFPFEPMDENEALWRHMAITVREAIPPRTRFEHQFDYGHPTDLVLEHVAVYEGLAQTISPSQPWNGQKTVVLARNHPIHSCLHCGRPAEWMIPQDSDVDEDPDDGLSDWHWEPDDIDRRAVYFCGECAPDDEALVILPNSPRQGVDCYDNVHSWRTWPLDNDDRW